MKTRTMTARTRVTLLAAALVVAGIATGCAPQGDASAIEPSVAQTGTPSSTPTATVTADARPDGILDVRLVDSFDDSVARTGALPAEGCARVATAQEEGYQLELQRADPPTDPVSPVEVVAVTTPVGNAAQGPVGPLTAEGIGIGSILDEAQTAYPDAEEVEIPDGRTYLKVATDDSTGSLFLAYSAETSVIWGVVATTLPAPPYEPCS